MKKTKIILIAASYLVTIIATAIITIKLYDDFLERKLMVNKHRYHLAKEQAYLELRERRLAIRQTEEENRLNEKLAKEAKQGGKNEPI